MPDLRLRSLLAAGLASGVVQVAAGIVMYMSDVYFAPWSGGVSRLLLAAGIVFGLRWYVVRVLDGRVTYVTAFLAGVFVAVTTELVYALYNVVSVSFFYPHFLDELAQARFALQPGSGLDPARASELMASLRAETTLSRVVIGNVRGFCLFGTVVSAVAAIGFRVAFPARSTSHANPNASLAREGARRDG